jgi:hypothetical protein
MSTTIIIPIEGGREISISAEKVVFFKRDDGAVQWNDTTRECLAGSVDANWETVIEIHARATSTQISDCRPFYIPRKSITPGLKTKGLVP